MTTIPRKSLRPTSEPGTMLHLLELVLWKGSTFDRSPCQDKLRHLVRDNREAFAQLPGNPRLLEFALGSHSPWDTLYSHARQSLAKFHGAQV